MTDTALIVRLEEAEGPDRDIDLEIWRTIDPVSIGVPDDKVPLPWLHCYTESTDAAVALAGRVLPGWTFDHMGQDYIAFGSEVMRIGWTVELMNMEITVQGQARTFPLATCIAILKAYGADK